MVPVINQFNIKAAVYGNHDFDFGVSQLEKLASQTNFPWLLTNVLKPDSDEVHHRFIAVSALR
jgi:5'-nucleotidase